MKSLLTRWLAKCSIPSRLPRANLRVEALEARDVPATFNVANGDVAGLINAIHAANTNQQADVISLASNGQYSLSAVNNQFVGANGLPVIVLDSGNPSNSLTIHGNGAKLSRSATSGTPVFRFFAVEGGAHLTLNGLQLQRGQSVGHGGGAVHSLGGFVTLSNVVLNDNRDVAPNGFDAWGGAVYIEYGSLTIQDSMISNNRAEATTTPLFTGTDGRFALGGAVFASDSDVTITNSIFTGNQALGGRGANGQTGSDGTNSGDPGSEGKAGGDGGAGYGGAVAVIDGSLRVSDATLTANLARGGDGGSGGRGGAGRNGAVGWEAGERGGDGGNGGSYGAAGAGAGGAVFALGSANPPPSAFVELTRVMVDQNTAQGGTGGSGGQGGIGGNGGYGAALVGGRGGTGGSGGHTAGAGPGGAATGGGLALNNFPTVTVHASTIVANRAVGGLGGAGLQGGTGGNGGDGPDHGAWGGKSGDGGHGGDSGGSLGGGFASVNAPLTLRDTLVAHNRAESATGGQGGVGGRGGDAGSGFYYGGYGGDGAFGGNGGRGGTTLGGGGYVFGSRLVADGSAFTENVAIASPGGPGGQGGQGGIADGRDSAGDPTASADGGNGGSGGDAGSAAGGALEFAFGSSHLINVTIAGNEARGGWFRPGGAAGPGGGIPWKGTNTGAPGAAGEPSNAGTGIGGGIHIDAGWLHLTHVTLAGNSVEGGRKADLTYEFGDGGGLHPGGGTIYLRNSLVALNSAVQGTDVYGTVQSFGHNLVGVVDDGSATQWAPSDRTGTDEDPLDPRLGPLQDNGGPTVTRALLPDSPAINAGDDAVLGAPWNLAVDQRGRTRLDGAHVDIGAYETDFTPPAVNLIPIAPSPRATPVAATQIVFSEPVVGFDLADLRLRRFGGANLLTGSESLTSADGGRTWTLSGLAPLTAAGGDYQFSLVGFQSGIADLSGHPLPTASHTVVWTTDVVAPRVVSIALLDPARTSAQQVRYQVTFSEPVIGVTPAGFDLIATNLTGAGVVIVSGSGTTWEVTVDTGTHTGPFDGVVQLRVTGVGIKDVAGNTLSATATGPVYQIDRVAPAVAAVVVNDGSAQRSMVTSLTVTFTEAVTFDGDAAGAFRLTRADGRAVGLAAVVALVDGRTVVTLTFKGRDVIGGSLADGSYQLIVLAGRIRDTAGNAPTADSTTQLTRLFGDSNGNGRLDEVDRAAFLAAYKSSTGMQNYRFWFDFDADGDVDAADAKQFHLRFVRPG